MFKQFMWHAFNYSNCWFEDAVTLPFSSIHTLYIFTSLVLFVSPKQFLYFPKSIITGLSFTGSERWWRRRWHCSWSWRFYGEVFWAGNFELMNVLYKQHMLYGCLSERFLLQVEEIREMIDNIADNVKKVKTKHGEILADPNTDDSKFCNSDSIYFARQLNCLWVDLNSHIINRRTQTRVGGFDGWN